MAERCVAGDVICQLSERSAREDNETLTFMTSRWIILAALLAISITSGCTSYRSAQRLVGIVGVSALDDGVQVEPGIGFRQQAGREIAMTRGDSLSIGDGYHVSINLQFRGRAQDRFRFRVKTYN